MCENPGYGYSTSGDKIEDDLLSVAATDPFAFTPTIDLRGTWKQPGKPALDAKEPEDLVEYGIRVPHHAVVATPDWGEPGLEKYLKAIELVEGRETIIDLSRSIEG